MSHDHNLPTSFAEVQECATALFAIITGKREASYIEIAAHCYGLLGYLLYVLGADEEHAIGNASVEAALALNADELDAIEECLSAMGSEQRVVGGPLSAWAIRAIVMAAVKQLLELLADLLETKDPEKSIAGLGDGTLLRVLLENLPAIMSAIAQLLDLFSKDDE